MYQLPEIRRVHLELTTRCNAACPMCSRNERGGFEIKGLPNEELSLADAERIFVPDFLAQLEQIWLCGNYGDPIVARDTLEIIRYFQSHNPYLRVGMNTNGSARTEAWWSELGSVLEYCHFGIDGLKDTNLLYRRRTDFEKIIRNACAYIASGGKATWEFIAFEHNEHQIEEARAMASELGFQRFRVRRTGRFYFDGAIQPELSVRNESGAVEYVIRPPSNTSLQNASSRKIQDFVTTGGTTTSYLNTTEISCKALRNKEIYISAGGYVLPCCFMGGLYSRPSSGKTQFRKLLDDHGGPAAFDGKNVTLETIIQSSLFQQAIPGSWSKNSVSEGRLSVCSSNCGAHCASVGQYSN